MGNYTGLLNKYKKFQEGGISMDDLSVDMSDLGMQESDFERQQGKALQSQGQGQFRQSELPPAASYDPAMETLPPPPMDVPESVLKPEAPKKMTLDNFLNSGYDLLASKTSINLINFW